MPVVLLAGPQPTIETALSATPPIDKGDGLPSSGSDPVSPAAVPSAHPTAHLVSTALPTAPVTLAASPMAPTIPAASPTHNRAPAVQEKADKDGVSQSQPGRVRTNAQDGAEMVYVSAGEFTMGSRDGETDSLPREKPAHKVYLDGYWIYQTPVTVAQYRKFCDATGRTMPVAPPWGWKDNHPIVNVSWNDAAAYSAWAGVRLPTEAEWEKAARGTDGRIYPWVGGFEPARLKCSRSSLGDAGSTAPVGSFPSGASPYGALDMAGNVWEWVADWNGKEYYKTSPYRNPKGPAFGTERILRGGSWWDLGTRFFRAADRTRFDPSGRFAYAGFRCAAGP